MDIDTFFRVLLRGWWLIVLAVLVTASSAAYAVSLQAPVYRATATVQLSPSDQLDDPRLLIDAQNSLERRTTINTLARNAMGSSMQDQVAKALGIELNVVENAEISAIVVPETNLIEVSARSVDPNYAALIANTVGDSLRKQVPGRVMQLTVIDQAVPPTAPIEPQPMRTITLGVMFGLVLGTGFALLSYALQRYRVVSAPAPIAASDSDGIDARANGAQTQQIFSR
ncbi:MAG: lipopolysaccharide biosynthesis protein [Chloroflexi bacterium]|nr:lipopolysaccharide biosynthesis protein [Chloroflexota bacterium]